MKGGVLLVENGWAFAITAPKYVSDDAGLAGDGAITSPMPGRVISLDVAEGDKVTKGQKLVTLEAMKMEHTLIAPRDGIVAELHVTPGDQVADGTLLLSLEPADDA